jgi:hypothetical protein
MSFGLVACSKSSLSEMEIASCGHAKPERRRQRLLAEETRPEVLSFHSVPLDPETMRRYMSKSQRACDSCRVRKSACRIDSSPPCRLCHLSGRQCTFEKTFRATRSIPGGPVSRVSPGTVNQTSSAITGSRVAEPYFDSMPASDAQFGQQNPEELLNNDLRDHDTEDFAPGYLLSGELGGVEDDSWLDQAMMDIGMQAFDQVDASPNAAATNEASGSLAAQTQEESISIVCGLTGDMDPYLMQRYNFDSNNNFVFKRLTVRSVSQDVHPVQLLMFNAPEEMKTSATDTVRENLEELVSPDVGLRLISLYVIRATNRFALSLTDCCRYYQFVYPHFPVIPLATPPDPRRSDPSLLAAIYLVTLSFAGFDDYLSVQIAYDLPDNEKLWDLALSATQQELHKPTFATLQTVILLLVAPSPKLLMPDYSTKWSLVGTMATVSQTLGLQFDASDWKISLGELELRKRLSWVVEMIDVWHAAVLGRTCLIREDSWLVKEPQLTDFSDQKSQTTMSKHFIHMYRLTIILRQVLNTLL